MSHSPFKRSRVLANRRGSRAKSGVMWSGAKSKLLHGFICPISTPNDCLNTLFDEVVSLRGSHKNNAFPLSPREKLELVAILSLRVKGLSLQERNMLFVHRPVKYEHTHLES